MNSATGIRKTRLAPKKIDSPLAKYSSTGQLSCIVCSQTVKSELVWTAHINGKVHRENVERAKREKKLPVAGVKRPGEPIATPKSIMKRPAVEEPPKPKSILKNPCPPSQGVIRAPPTQAVTRTTEIPKPAAESKVSGVPTDFFDNTSKEAVPPRAEAEDEDSEKETPSQEKPHIPSEEEPEGKKDAKIVVAEALPEGFFDDPVKDAKARHVEYKDPIEEEYAKFQKSIQEAAAESSALIEADEEEEASGRQLEEIDEQLRHWSRVVALEKKKEVFEAEVATLRAVKKEEPKEEESDDDDDDFDESVLLDWRAKSSRHSKANP